MGKKFNRSVVTMSRAGGKGVCTKESSPLGTVFNMGSISRINMSSFTDCDASNGGNMTFERECDGVWGTKGSTGGVELAVDEMWRSTVRRICSIDLEILVTGTSAAIILRQTRAMLIYSRLVVWFKG